LLSLLTFLLSITDAVKGLNVVVTGASSGLGEEIANQFASMGAKLVITARNERNLQKVSA